MIKTILRTVLVSLAACLFCLASSSARPAVVLAEDYPYASLFMHMARRGLAEYSGEHGAFPETLQQLVAEGYTAYNLPGQMDAPYEVFADRAEFSTGGHSSYALGMLSDFSDYHVNLPGPGLYETAELPIPVDGDPDNRQLQEVKLYAFPGAQWLDEGYNLPDVKLALRVERILIHTVRATQDYIAEFGQPPADLEELEAFVGVGRNPAGWDGVQLAGFAGDVLRPGDVFIGWEEGAWTVKGCYLDMVIVEDQFTISNSGVWQSRYNKFPAY